MKVGVVEPVEEVIPPKRKRSRRSGGGSNRPSGGGGKGGGPDDSGGPSGGGFDRPPDKDIQEKVPDKSKVVSWFLLIVVLMTFGGLIGAYIVISTNGVAEWQPFALPIQV